MEDVNQVLFEREEDTLRWFDDYLKDTSGSFFTFLELFRKYYDKCFQDLIHLKLDSDATRVEYSFLPDDKENSSFYECNYINQDDINQSKNNHYHLNIIEVLKNNEYLRDTCIKYDVLSKEVLDKIERLSYDEIKKMTTEELYLLVNDSSYFDLSIEERKNKIKQIKLSREEENQFIVPFLKVHRMNNLQVKYAHTARVVYLTNYQLDSFHITSPLVRDIALTSALFHDVGRFYQGAFYNHFGDQNMIMIEGEGKGHAEAGYYYSLLDMISLNTLGVNQSEDLMIHAIASLVVNRHQASNAKNKEFDQAQENLSFSDNIDEKLLNFVLDAYLKAKPFEGGVHARFGRQIPHQQKYMRQALDNILNTIKKVEQQYITNEEDLNLLLQNIQSFLVNDKLEDKLFFLRDDEVLLLKKYPTDLSIIYKDDDKGNQRIVRTPELNQYIDKIQREEFCKEKGLDIRHYGVLLEQAKRDLAKFSQFDIVDSIRHLFQEKKVDLEVEKLVDFCLNVVMDADKLDIFVQRVNKRWDNWNPKDMKVYTDPNNHESFLDVLENVYGISVENNFEQLKRIVQYNMNSNHVFDKKVKEVIDLKKEPYSEEEINHFMNLLRGDFYQLMITDKVKKDSDGDYLYDEGIVRMIKDKENKDSSLKSTLAEKGIVVTKELVGNKIPQEIVPILEKSGIPFHNTGNNYVKISYDEMKNHYIDDKERMEREINILLPEDLREKVFLYNQDRGDNKFPLGRKASSNPHFAWDTIFPAIWWHIDQFIMTNMRSLKSFEFIQDVNLLDRLKDVYCSPECPVEFSFFINDIIEYAKDFLDTAKDYSYDMMDEDKMIEIRDLACTKWRERNKNQELDTMLQDDNTSIQPEEMTTSI